MDCHIPPLAVDFTDGPSCSSTLYIILLGGGTSLFGGLDPASLALERTRLIDAEGVTHLSFRIERPG